MSLQINVSREELAQFCRRWQIREFCFFGSVLRTDFRPDSDVDVLVSFEPSAQWTLFDLVAIKQELEDLFQRKVDLLTRRSVEASSNWIRRQSILETAECVYAA